MVRINDNLFPEPVIIKTPSEVVNVDFDFVDEIPSRLGALGLPVVRRG